jgi:hypothetical protein
VNRTQPVALVSVLHWHSNTLVPEQVNHLDVVEEPQHCHEAVKAFVGVDSYLLDPQTHSCSNESGAKITHDNLFGP